MIFATVKARKNHPMAVMNHPKITWITQLTRSTALSRPQALSANAAPIPTINVTYVVERGSL
jgi:hypothetical protein